MEGFLLLLLILGVMNESSTPVWSDKPQECKQITFEPDTSGSFRIITRFSQARGGLTG